MHNSESKYESVKNHFLKNYKYCAEGSVFFILGTIASFRGHMTSPMDKSFAYWSRFLWPLTPLTLAGGLLGAVGNTLWGAYALPAAMIEDAKHNNNQNLPTSTVTDNNDAVAQVNQTDNTMSSTNQIFKSCDVKYTVPQNTQPTQETNQIEVPASQKLTSAANENKISEEKSSTFQSIGFNR